MKITCFNDGHEMKPTETIIRGNSVDIRYRCQYCNNTITISHEFENCIGWGDEALTVDDDIPIRRLP